MNEQEKMPVVNKEPKPRPATMTIDAFLANSKKVKQFSKLNEIAFKKNFLELFKKDPKANSYHKTEFEWETLYQKLVGVKF